MAINRYTDDIAFSNPRVEATIENWPVGGHNKASAHFIVEQRSLKGGAHASRVARRTRKPNGRWGNPKRTTYGRATTIVDGSDERTYVLQIMANDMIHLWLATLNQSQYLHKRDDPERFAALVRMMICEDADKFPADPRQAPITYTHSK